MSKTLEQVRIEGLEALRKKLGKAGMIRFLQQFSAGNGDYASERHKWVDRTSIDAIRKLSVKLKNKTNGL